MVDPTRLIEPQYDFYDKHFPGLNFRKSNRFTTSGEPVILTDPVYLADVYNSQDESAEFVRANGVIIGEFGGDISGPVWWQHPYLLIPLSMQLPDDVEPPAGVAELPGSYGVDSGSITFLPLTRQVPAAIKKAAKEMVARKLAMQLRLPAGEWAVYYEQWEPKEGYSPSWYRNIVVRWEGEIIR